VTRGGAIVLALFVAALGWIGLLFWARTDDRRRQVHAAERAVATAEVEPAAASTAAQLGFQIRPCPGPVLLAGRMSSFAPDVAPIVEVLPDGTLALRRPPVLPAGPLGGIGAADGSTCRPGILVATGAAGQVEGTVGREAGAAARGALLRLIQQFVLDCPVPRGRIVVLDDAAAGLELEALLRWAL
jgi:hypothetical protein